MNAIDDCFVRSRQSGLQFHALDGHELISTAHGLPCLAMNGDHDTGHVRARLVLRARAGSSSGSVHGTAQYECASAKTNVYIIAYNTPPSRVLPSING